MSLKWARSKFMHNDFWTVNECLMFLATLCVSFHSPNDNLEPCIADLVEWVFEEFNEFIAIMMCIPLVLYRQNSLNCSNQICANVFM